MAVQKRLNRRSTVRRRAVRPDPVQEEGRRQQLIDVTLDSLAEEGFSGSTLQVIARRARVSAGLVAHYFGDKDGLLDAAFRSLSRRVADQVRQRLKVAGTPRERIQAVIDGNLAPGEFDRRTGTAWLAFWDRRCSRVGCAASSPRTSAACSPTCAARSGSSCRWPMRSGSPA